MNKCTRSVLKVRCGWQLAGMALLDQTFVKMMTAEQSQLTRPTIDECMKSSISQNYAKNLEDEMIELGANIQREILNILREIFQNVMNNVAVRIQADIGRQGG